MTALSILGTFFRHIWCFFKQSQTWNHKQIYVSQTCKKECSLSQELWLVKVRNTCLSHPSVETKLCFFLNVQEKTLLGIVLWSYLCVVVASQSLYLDKKWRKKDLFSMTLLSKISAKGKNNLYSLGELNFGLQSERPTTWPLEHQIIFKISYDLSNNMKLTSKSCTV